MADFITLYYSDDRVSEIAVRATADLPNKAFVCGTKGIIEVQQYI